MANNQDLFEGNGNNTRRVYINPNFQRQQQALQTRSTYFNPLFTHRNVSVNYDSKPKIYVNPNFVKPSVQNYQYSANNSVIRTNENNYQYSIPSTSSTGIPEIPVREFKPPANTNVVAKSRYSLVRQNPISNNTEIQASTQPIPKVLTTYKINKYKSVSVETLKNNIKDVEKPTNNILNVQTMDKKKTIVSPRVFQSRFKLIKKSTITTPKKGDIKSPLIRRRSLNSSKTKVKLNHRLKLKIDKGQFKKNNIPCPQFRKYGKCLRSIQGQCEFLHDRKQVTICRKFLKGICHDKNCLLSHEVTAEKMPTCAFYLKGMCTREECPYLHVKLNEKAKICPDFLKGYCDKGDTCLNKHIHACPDLASKGVCLRKSCPYPHKTNRASKTSKNPKVYVNIKMDQKRALKKPKEDSKDKNDEQENKEQDGRYYKIADSSSSEIKSIKPTRCKLGALPSFIEL